MHCLIGSTAGHVWEYVRKNGPVTLLKIKSALGISNSLLCLALGWLAREDKIDIAEYGHTYTVTLKQ